MYNSFVLPDPSSYTFLCKKKTDMCLRGLVEADCSNDLIFITLTYDSNYLPDTYKKVKSISAFNKRFTRRKIQTEECKKWFTVESKPVNVSLNHYRTKNVCNEQDFKNAKHRYKEYCENKNIPCRCGLLVPQHLKDALKCLRNDIRLKIGDDNFHLRFLANGEYGQSTHRPHFHIVIFNRLKEYDYYSFFCTYWIYGRVIQVKRVSKSNVACKKLTSYICGHTVKCDCGNIFQNEFSKPFNIQSTFGGGIGCQLLTDPGLLTSSFCRSLVVSLSAWDKKSKLLYLIESNGTRFEYPFPTYYLKKKLNILARNERDYFESQFKSVHNLCRRFCLFAHFYGHFDLLPILSELGLYSTPQKILEYFILFNNNLRLKFGSCEEIRNFVANFFSTLNNIDKKKKEKFLVVYKRRKQSLKYKKYMIDNNLQYDLT